MSSIDDWLGKGLPVFHGAKNRSVARSMIDRLGGPGGFKTSIVTHPDGSVTTVRLKGDMPPQITTVFPPKKEISFDFTERDYEARTYSTVELNFSHDGNYGYHNFDYVKTIQLFDANGIEHLLTFPDPYGNDSYAEILVIAPNKIAKIPISPPKKAELTGLTTATLEFDAPAAAVDFFDVVSDVTVFPLSMRKTKLLVGRAIGMVERGIETVAIGGRSFKFARPEDSL